jgi:tetratricopeptide (TPR) repeat protein
MESATNTQSLQQRRSNEFVRRLLEKKHDIEAQLSAPPPMAAAPEGITPATGEYPTPQEEDVAYAQAERLIAEGQSDAAIATLRDMARRGALRWDIYNDLGTLLLTAGETAEAFQALKTAAGLEFSSTQALRNLIVAYVQQGDVANALAATGLLLKKDRDNPDLPGFLRDLLLETPTRIDDYSWLSNDLAARLEELAQVKERLAQEAPRYRLNECKAQLYDWIDGEALTPAILGGNAARERFWTAPEVVGHMDLPSCIVLHPVASGAASVARILIALTAGHYRYLSFEIDAFYANDPYKGELSAMRGYDYQLAGTVYSWRESSRLRDSLINSALSPGDFRYLVILRDPRDSLVSLYHILKNEKHLPPKNLTAFKDAALNEKRQAESLSLDDYVIENAHDSNRNITVLAALLASVPRDKIEFLSYAVLCDDLPRFIERLTRFLQIKPESSALETILRTEDVKKKDSLIATSLAHFEKAAPMPGRHKRELRPDTIAKLNEITAEARRWMASLEAPEYRHLYDD